MIWAVVPAKARAVAKARLAAEVSPALRAALARAMLDDVLRALRSAPVVAGIIVVTADGSLAELASRHGALPVREGEPAGLDAAVASGVAEAVRRDADSVLIAMGDLPLLDGSEIGRLLARLPARGAVAAPSRDGTGTNLLAIRPPTSLPTHFGPGSLGRHRVEAASRGLVLLVEPVPSAALDVDTPGDLERLRQLAAPGTATRALLDGRPLAAAASARGSVG